jgi:hypothetical protein
MAGNQNTLEMLRAAIRKRGTSNPVIVKKARKATTRSIPSGWKNSDVGFIEGFKTSHKDAETLIRFGMEEI